MDSARRAPGVDHETEALEFVRYCYGRRRIGWPELYDEMCAVAGRGLYRGWSADELAAVGIGFSLFEMPGLAALTARVIAECPPPERRQDPARSRAGTAASAGRRPVAEATGATPVERHIEAPDEAAPAVGAVLLASGAT